MIGNVFLVTGAKWSSAGERGAVRPPVDLRGDLELQRKPPASRQGARPTKRSPSVRSTKFQAPNSKHNPIFKS